jgi:hypothetical protein
VKQTQTVDHFAPVKVMKTGALTTATITVDTGNELVSFSGVARKHGKDKNRQEIGENLAIGRAMQKAGKYFTKQAEGLVKHADDMNMQRAVAAKKKPSKTRRVK